MSQIVLKYVLCTVGKSRCANEDQSAVLKLSVAFIIIKCLCLFGVTLKYRSSN